MHAMSNRSIDCPRWAETKTSKVAVLSIKSMEDSDSPFFKSGCRTRSKPSNRACGPVDVDPPGTAASAGRPATPDVVVQLTVACITKGTTPV